MSKAKLQIDLKKHCLVGDVKFTTKAIDSMVKTNAPTDFLTALQNLMEEFGVVKIDVSIDAFELVNQSNHLKLQP